MCLLQDNHIYSMETLVVQKINMFYPSFVHNFRQKFVLADKKGM